MPQTQMTMDNPQTIDLFSSGVNNAVSGLSKMVGREINIANLRCNKIPVKDIPNLFGGPEAYIVGVYLAISGDSSGHIFVAYEPAVAFELIDLLLGQAPGSTGHLDEMERSVLGEVGNIMGSFFLNYVSDIIKVRLQPSPPAVMMDMAGAILDSTMANIIEYSDYVYVIETVFGTPDRHVVGNFMVTIM
jgi:chemotaxis protein CheC